MRAYVDRGTLSRLAAELRAAVSGGNAQAGRYLWVVAPDIREQLVNEPAHQGSGGVNPRNELRYNLG